MNPFALIILARVALLSGALWLIGHAARRESLAVRRTAALLSLFLVALAPASLWLPTGLFNLHSGSVAAPGAGPMALDSGAFYWNLAGCILSAMYLAGVAVALLRFGLGLKRLAAMQLHPAPRHSQRLLRQIAPAGRRPRLYVSRDCRLPFSTQIFPGGRGRIVLPSGLIGSADRGTLAAILRHEYRHLTGNDPWWSLFSRLMCALFWPVPFVHALNGQLDDVQERSADEAAIGGQSLPAKALYAECLIALASRPGLSRPVAVVCAAVGRSFHSLEGRIRSILAGPEGAETSGRRAAVRRRLCNGISALVVLALPVIFLIGITPVAPAGAASGGVRNQAGEPAEPAHGTGGGASTTLEEQEAALRVPIATVAPVTPASLWAEELRLRAGL